MDIQTQLIPAECGNCGYLYPSGYGFDPADTGVEVSMTVFENAEVEEPCPMCGRHRGRVLAVEHQFVRGAEGLLRGSGELDLLAGFLRGARERNASDEEMREAASEEAPALSGLVERLLDARPERVELTTWHALLSATIRALGTGGDEGRVQPAQVIYDSVNGYNVTTVQPSPTADAARSEAKKVGRNDPCPCGSGKKYKKCHGSPTAGAGTP